MNMKNFIVLKLEYAKDYKQDCQKILVHIGNRLQFIKFQYFTFPKKQNHFRKNSFHTQWNKIRKYYIFLENRIFNTKSGLGNFSQIVFHLGGLYEYNLLPIRYFVFTTTRSLGDFKGLNYFIFFHPF